MAVDNRNLCVVTGGAVPIQIFQHENLGRIAAWKILNVCLNLDSLSSAIPTGLALPNVMLIYSNTFASLSNNNMSYVNGVRKNLIAAYPIHLGYATTSGGRTTWSFETIQEFAFVHPVNVNRYDFDVYLDNGQIQLEATDRVTIVMETINRART